MRSPNIPLCHTDEKVLGIETTVEHDIAYDNTDRTRWRLLGHGGRNIWHYVSNDEEAERNPQTVIDKYHLSLPMNLSALSQASTPGQAIFNAMSNYSKLQLPSGHWACEEGGPLFLLPGLVITWFVTETPIPDPVRIEIKNYLFAKQNLKDGSWGLHVEAEGSVFGLAMNYTTLRILGVGPNHPRMVKARQELKRLGGALNAPHWAKFWLSVLGATPWDLVNPAPPELWLLPDWVPFAPWRWWIHMRQVYLPMSFIWSRKWCYPPCELTRQLREELFVQPFDAIQFSAHRNSISPRDSFHKKSWILNALNWSFINIWAPYMRIKPIVKLAEAWTWDLVKREDENTDFINLGPVSAPMNTLVCYIQDGPNSKSFSRHQDRLTDYLWMTNDGMLMNGTNGAQVWDTAFSVQALVEAGIANDPLWQPTLTNALRFLNDHQIRDNCKDQNLCYRHQRKGAWPFSTRQQGYTVSDCTAEALRGVLLVQSIPGYPQLVCKSRLHDAVDVLLSLQNATGGCASYERRRGSEALECLNAAEVFRHIMIEYDYVECTTACLLALRQFRKLYSDYRVSDIDSFIYKAMRFVRSTQRDDGSWYGSWGICFTYATMFGLEALASDGDTWKNSESVRSACEFILSHQRVDGGWGESYRSCEVDTYVEHEETQIVQTAWSCLALMEAEYPHREPIEKGIRVIMQQQHSDGGWSQGAIEGVFNKSGMISYTNYKYIFSLKALGKFRKTYGDLAIL